MACKHLKTHKTLQRIVESGGGGVDLVDEQYCDLHRDPPVLGWISTCEGTAVEGPCWWYADEHHGQKDRQF